MLSVRFKSDRGPSLGRLGQQITYARAGHDTGRKIGLSIITGSALRTDEPRVHVHL